MTIYQPVIIGRFLRPTNLVSWSGSGWEQWEPPQLQSCCQTLTGQKWSLRKLWKTQVHLDMSNIIATLKKKIDRKNIFIAPTSTAGWTSCTRAIPKGSTYVWHQTSWISQSQVRHALYTAVKIQTGQRICVKNTRSFLSPEMHFEISHVMMDI